MLHQDLRKLAYSLGGDVAGSDTILCPGPGHSARDRSLAVRFEADRTGWICLFIALSMTIGTRVAIMVRSRLGLPEWQPGDERQRTIPAATHQEMGLARPAMRKRPTCRQHLMKYQLKRIASARNLWSEAEPELRGTLAESLSL